MELHNFPDLDHHKSCTINTWLSRYVIRSSQTNIRRLNLESHQHEKRGTSVRCSQEFASQKLGLVHCIFGTGSHDPPCDETKERL